ncbi:MAG: hypothetical protein JNK21_00810, partial [Rhodospirillaceae bacterium]|nr:hypothetical protein [Rhodospirillaceae bacterium]
MFEYKLRQPGRAGLDFLAAFGAVAGPLQKAQNDALAEAGLTVNESLADDLDERAAQIESVLEAVPAFRTAGLVAEWHA